MIDGGGQPAIALEVSSLLVSRPSGIAVFGAALIRELRSLLGSERVELVYSCTRFRKRRYHPSPGLRLRPYLDGRRLHRRYDLLHTLDTRLPAAFQGRWVATVHDVISALPISVERGLSTERFRERKREKYRVIAERADAVVTISEETRKRFCAMFDVRGPVEVVYPGVDTVFTPQASDDARIEQLGLEPGNYVLSVGELCQRKNLEAVIETFLEVRRQHASQGQGRGSRRGRLQLVLVGRESFGWHESPARRLAEQHRDCVRLLGFVSVADLASLYAGASAFLHLAHYEGFGLPILEAMAAGTPVVAAACGGVPEAAGEASLLVEPDVQSEAVQALGRLLDDPDLARRKRQAGLERAAIFTWEHTARQVSRVYEHLLYR
jgi:glycosyltransferase involved in cell wall biosynthesis